LIQSACSTSSTQQLTLKASPASGWYYLVSPASNLCWDIAGGSSAAGAFIQQYTCTAVWPEYFQLKAVTGGYEILSGNLPNGCVDIAGSSSSSGAHIEQNTCTRAANQIFSIGGKGTSGPSQLTASPASVGFGNVITGTKTSQTVKLTNSSTASLAISQATVSGVGFSFTGLTSPATLAAGTSTTFTVVFAPSSAGSVTGSVSLVSDASNSPDTIALSGTGVSPNPFIAISSPASDATVSGTITVSGTASDSVALSSVAVQVDGGAFSTASGTSNWSFSLNTTSLSNAAHTITAKATDTSGSTASTSISVTVSNSTSTGNTLNVLNYGATGNGSTDDTAAINRAIAALSSGDTLLFPCGTYLTTSQLTLNLSSITIDGSSCATIHNTSSGTVLTIGGNGNGNPNYSSAVALSATANELATSFSTTSSLGVSPGDYVLLQQGGQDSSTSSGNTGCDPSGCRGELLKVASVSGNSITVTTALHDTYSPSVNNATAQKLLNPLSGLTIKNITLDGNSSNVYGLAIAGVADSSVSGVTVTNVQGSALLNRGDFNLSWSTISVTHAGSAQCGSAVWFENQGNLQINGLAISNENQGSSGSGCLANGAFGFELVASANSSISNLSVNASGAFGRPFKTTAARYNTFNSTSVQNGAAAYNGISLEYYSSHNTYNNCSVSNNGAGTGTGTGNAGIITFGNFNQYNSFNNCTVSGNGNVQFYISGYDALRLAQDSHNTISGGTFTGSNSSEAVILIEGDGAYITGATINGPGPQGIYLDTQATNACVNNNTFTAGTSLGTAISANSTGDLGLGNILNLLGNNLAGGTCAPPLP
jgi:polygalacturonase